MTGPTPDELVEIQASVAEETDGNTFFEKLGDSVLIVDYIAPHHILGANTHLLRRLGYSLEEILTLTIADLETITHRGESTHSAAMSTAGISGTEFYECDFTKKDGTKVPVGVSSRFTSVGGRAVTIRVIRDISRRIQLINDLEAYAYRVAHDLKNPVTLQIGFSDVLAQDFTGMDPEEVVRYLWTINDSAITMREIIDSLFLLASINKNDWVERTPLDMEMIIQTAQDRLANLIADSRTTLVLPESWHSALGYAPWVEGVMVNYISNAIKYGGTPPHIELGSDDNGDGTISYWVRDNGQGIEPENLGHVFGEFTRFDQDKAEGHGVGLSIVKRIAEKLDGSVGVQSTAGEGSVFSITLPAG